jgi:hypothetical protein
MSDAQTIGVSTELGGAAENSVGIEVPLLNDIIHSESSIGSVKLLDLISRIRIKCFSESYRYRKTTICYTIEFTLRGREYSVQRSFREFVQL